MKKGLKLVGLASLLATANFSQVQAREFADIYCDCGLGAMIAPNNKAVAAVTNVTWDLGTTAITSNITSPESCMGGKEKVAALIFHSYEQLEKDLAMGQGEYLDALMNLSGVESAEQNTLTTSVREGFVELVSKADYASMDKKAKAEELYNIFYSSLEA